MSAPIDPLILKQLMDDHGAALKLFAAQWTSSPEDCVQEAFLELMRQRQAPQNNLAWLYRVVRNCAISWHRKAQRQRRREAMIGAGRVNWFAAPHWSAAELDEVTTALQESMITCAK